jgi:hypothetical protein
MNNSLPSKGTGFAPASVSVPAVGIDPAVLGAVAWGADGLAGGADAAELAGGAPLEVCGRGAVTDPLGALLLVPIEVDPSSADSVAACVGVAAAV